MQTTSELMACNPFLSYRISISFSSLCKTLSPLLRTSISFPTRSPQFNPIRFHSRSMMANSFSWDDVFRISQADNDLDDSSDLQGFFERVKACNRGCEKKSEFIPFVIEQQIVGYIHNRFANHLREFHNVFDFLEDKSYSSHFGGYITLNPSLKSSEDRTEAVADVINCLGGLIPGTRNELYPVTSSFGKPEFFSLERAAAPYFGIKPHGITCKENILKECEEEAGLPRSISNRAVPVGVVSYMDINGYSFKRDVLFCYDLELPDEFIPTNQDGEVESFKLVPVTHVMNIIRRVEFFKPNCSLVITDFLFRHGYISPENDGYLQLLQSLRSGDCS
uniref:Nudix hydrolase domain-containing protein n=1 Tax=Nelumbo nucifera TaxID=4432 RepID=A0A822ZEX6_NELNU|nr:TPA_asm: hypothetical protein HUJ06_002984 [Nelumbo nucifera]